VFTSRYVLGLYIQTTSVLSLKVNEIEENERKHEGVL
jgi:hypothetical protein